MNTKQRSLKNILYSALGQIVTIGFGLILPRLFVVSYGSEVNGLLNSLNQLLVYLGLFEAGIGAATLQALYHPVALDDWDSINHILAATNVYYRRTGRFYFIALVGTSLVYPFIVNSELSYVTICGAVFFSGVGNVVLFYFQGKYRFLLQAEGKNYITENLTTIVSVMVSLSKVLLISLNANIILILGISFFIQCLQAFYILWYIRRGYPKLRLDVAPDHQAIAQRNYALVHQISALIFQNTDVLILSVVCGLRVVSVYSMFKLVTSHLERIISLFLNSISFVLGQNFQVDKRLFIQRIDIVESYYSAMVYALFSVALFLFLPFMRLYTAGVTDINYIDPWLALLFVLISLLNQSRMPMLQVINYAGHYRQTMPQTIAESIINLAVSLVGVCFLGIYGVLLGTVVALAYRTNDIILYANRKLLDRVPWRSYMTYFIDILLFLVTQLLFRRLFSQDAIHSWFQLVLVGTATTALSLVILFGGQTLLSAHCRVFVKELFQRFRCGRR